MVYVRHLSGFYDERSEEESWPIMYQAYERCPDSSLRSE